MIAGWRAFRVFTIRRRVRRDRVRRVPAFGLEILEDRRLLAGLTMSPGFGLSAYDLTVSEGGVSEAFEVFLTAQPATDVVFDVSSSNPGDAAVWPDRLTFTPDNWDLSQVVWVTAVDDPLVDGSQTSEIQVRVDQEASDSSFAWLSYQSLYATTLDNDVAGFILSKTSLTVSESGTPDTFTVMLNVQPNSDVMLVAIAENDAEATLDPAVLTFSPTDWDQPQTITVTGQDDFRIDGDQTTLVTVSVAPATLDSRFAELDEQTVSVITTDDDLAGFVLSKTVAIVSEAGTEDTLTVVLTAQPETNVRLTVLGDDASEAAASPAELVFSPADWNSSQTVTILGVDDSERDGDQESAVTIAVDSGQSDGKFAAVAPQTVSVTTVDNDYGWHNVDNPFDTDGDGFVTANDVLIIINYINGNSGNTMLPSPPVSPPPYYDVNNDSSCTALDILLVINYINTQSAATSSTSGAGEGESLASLRDAAPAATGVPLEWQRGTAVPPVSKLAELSSDPLEAPRSDSTSVPLPVLPLAESPYSCQPVRLASRVPMDWEAAVDAALDIWQSEWDDISGPPSGA